jgi:hypothetical protein
MNDYTIFTISFFLILSLLIGGLAEKRKIGFLWGFLLSFFLSPLIGLIITLCSKKKNNKRFKEEN